MTLPENYPVDHGYFLDFFHLIESIELGARSDLLDRGSATQHLSPTLKQKSPGQIERKRLKQVKKRQAKRQNKRLENRKSNTDRFPPMPANTRSPGESNPVTEDNDLELPLTSKADANIRVEGLLEVTLEDLKMKMTDEYFPHSGSVIVGDSTKQLFITHFQDLTVTRSMMETMFMALRPHFCPESFSTIDQARNALFHQLIEYDILYQKFLNLEEAHMSLKKWETDILYELDSLRKFLGLVEEEPLKMEASKKAFSTVELPPRSQCQLRVPT